MTITEVYQREQEIKHMKYNVFKCMPLIYINTSADYRQRPQKKLQDKQEQKRKVLFVLIIYPQYFHLKGKNMYTM